MKFTIHEVIHATTTSWNPTFIKGTVTTLWDTEPATLIIADGIWRNTKTGCAMPKFIQAQINQYLEALQSTPSESDSKHHDLKQN